MPNRPVAKSPPRLYGDSLTGLDAADWLGDRWKDSGIRVRRRLARLGKTRSDCSSSRDFFADILRYNFVL